jgi:hypothetical protein
MGSPRGHISQRRVARRQSVRCRDEKTPWGAAGFREEVEKGKKERKKGGDGKGGQGDRRQRKTRTQIEGLAIQARVLARWGGEPDRTAA